MDNYVITIGRELGSGGKHIGEIMAKQLNIPIYDRRLLDMAAQESGFNKEIFQKADEISDKSLLASAIRSISSSVASMTNFYKNSMSKDSLFQFQSDAIREKAKTESCIIVGRCADYILRDHPRHINIFIRADKEDRIRFVSERYNITKAEAENKIEKVDDQRSEYHDFYCETNWGDSRAYDICVNSSILGAERTAQYLLEYVKEALKI